MLDTTAIRIVNSVDENLNPAGGTVEGMGLRIQWQNGPLSVDGVRKEPNGAFVEGVLYAVQKRLEFYQSSKFNCLENEAVLNYVIAAINILQSRTKRREDAGVEGTHQGN